MSDSKIIYYYQSFTNLEKLVATQLKNVYIYVSSLHFGMDQTGTRIFYLNNSSPDCQMDLWMDILKTSLSGMTILVMLGGAGGAYHYLFQDFETYYEMLYLFLKKYPFIRGIDLDVEETITLDNIKSLINRLHQDFGKDFIITMAPIEAAMSSDFPGLGGFSYKTLYHSPEGQRINWFNVQCYASYTAEVYQEIIKNGYPEEKITFGMLGDNFTNDTFTQATTEIKKIVKQFPKMNGVCLWEYGDTKVDPIIWSKTIRKIFS